MKITRRNFVKAGTLAGTGIITNKVFPKTIFENTQNRSDDPIVISTWDFGKSANAKALELLIAGSSSLDAVEMGIHVPENDPEVNTVGYGGLPDEEGRVTLDACIMDWYGNAGSVAYLEGIKNPISVARLIMEKTKHVMLAGDGAKEFALKMGFKEENLLTEQSKETWLKWKKENPDGTNWVGDPNKIHDTIGMLAIDKKGNMSGGVSTSGMGFKMHGRVGDSPIIGAAIFVDNEAGGACATGNGEFVMRTVGSFLIVEKMREGYSPQEACEIAVKRIYKPSQKNENIQIGYLAMNKNGEFGAFSLKKGFVYSVADSKQNKIFDSAYLIQE